MQHTLRKGFSRMILAVLSLSGLSLPVWADPQVLQLNLAVGVTPISHMQHHMHMLILAVVTVIAILVFGVLIYSLFKYRHSKGAQPAHFHENVHVEIIWTVIPFIILVLLAIPASRDLIMTEDTEKSEITIAVTGYQWYWHYEYLNEDVGFFSNLASTKEQIGGLMSKGPHYLLEVDNPLVLPTNTKIRFAVTSNDVLHSWFVPELGVKRDTIPGFINEAWAVISTPGIYRGQCAELCGVRHGFMPIVVDARTPEDYQAWLAEQKAKQQAKPAS